ncbi:MAG: hypothetical protein ACXVLQ_18645 [Bacteriovorax sp.]
MKNLALCLVLISTSIVSFASDRNFSLAGKYIYNGDGKMEGSSSTIYFPSALRNDTDTGYENSEQPPVAWYAKIPKNTDIVIKDLGDTLEIEHTSLFGAYVPSQIGGVITSPVDLRSLGRETVEVSNADKTITFSRKDGNFLAGQKINVKITKLSNGDILVNEFRKGWAPLPSPLPIYVRSEYTLRQK